MNDKVYTIMFPSKEIFEGYKALIERTAPIRIVRFPEHLMVDPDDIDEWFIAPIYEGIEND